MRVPNRIAEFEGPAELAEAGLAALNNPRCDAAIVRGLVDTSVVKLSTGSPAAIQDSLYQAVPQTAELDVVVDRWWERNGANTGMFIEPGGVISAGILKRKSAVHIDYPWGARHERTARTALGDTFRGPLFVSIRTDDHEDQERIYYARRVEGEPTLRDGLYDSERGKEIFETLL